MHIIELSKSTTQLNIYETDALLEDFFQTTFNAANFLYVWKYMDGYLDVDKGSELGKFYMKGI